MVFNESASNELPRTRPRRAVVCAGPSVAVMLERHLSSAQYATVIASASDAARVISQFAPDVVLLAMHNGMDGERIALARRLRAEPSTYALPIVFLHHKDERSLRSTALNIGADDYFSLATPAGELCARLDALFWRAEAGRRSAPAVGEQRAEIDNFLLLLDSVREDMQDTEEGGALALVEAVSGADGAGAAGDRSGSPDTRTLAEAHGFLKLNLRRADSVAFYGPTMLFAYLPRMSSDAARTALAGLREEFKAKRPGSDLAVGLVSFPADGLDVEALIEKAESAIDSARTRHAPSRVVVYVADGQHTAPQASTQHAPQTTASTQKSQDADTPPPTATTANQNANRSVNESVNQTAPVAPKPNVAGMSARTSFSSTQVLRERGGADASGVGAVAATLQQSGAAGGDGEAAARAAADAGARELERRARGAPMPRRLLLTISDPARMAQLNLLIRSAGYDVRAAFDGQQALNLLRIERPDVLVLDDDLHGIDGLETLRRLRRQQSGERRVLPVVLLLDAKHQSRRREALESGAHAIVTLPYDPSDFLDTVREAGNVE